MTAVRMARGFLALIFLLLWISCGQYYRPVANPQPPNPPNPNFNHDAFVISGNGNSNPGASTTIDVSGDTAISQSTLGLEPVHAAILPLGTRIYAANSLDNTVSAYAPTSPAPVTSISLPPGSNPSFVATAENDLVYVANSGSNTVSAISVASNVIANTIPVGVNPVAIAETPNALTVYVASQGNATSAGSVTSINVVDFSANPVSGVTWISPIWVATRSDSFRAYALDTAIGKVFAIDTSSNAIVGSAAVGVGADYLLYDPKLNRLYVTNPTAGTVTMLDASSDVLSALVANVPNAIAVAALPDGSRVYVASGSLAGGAVTSQVTVLYTANLSVKATIPITTVPAVNGCRNRLAFELAMAAAADSSRVYIGNCDAGNTAFIDTSNESLLLQMPAPLSAQPASSPGGTPPPQNPVFVFAGP
jgi:YVTN family beta-propeller protein